LRLPKKITPDSIREAVVELRYATLLPFNVIPGILFKIFDDTYTYTDRPIKSIPEPQPEPVPQNEIRLKVASQVLIYNEKLIMYARPSSFVFTCRNEYIGWQNFREEIAKALALIQQDEIITHWNRIGVRYISDYPGQDLRKCTRFNFTFGFPETRSDTVGLKSEFSYENSRVILNLANHVPLQVTNKHGSAQTVTTSVIDIDVIRDVEQSIGLEHLLTTIDHVHMQQKELFFRLLKEEFLESLRPEY
jgi:uncharacterized protein (TIGR04255 family)